MNNGWLPSETLLRLFNKEMTKLIEKAEAGKVIEIQDIENLKIDINRAAQLVREPTQKEFFFRRTG